MVKKLLSTALLLVLAEALYVTIGDVSWRDREGYGLSFGLPFRSVQYGFAGGTIGPIPEPERASGFYADPALFAVDVAVGMLSALLLIQCVPAAALALLVKGCVLGTLAGAIVLWLAEARPESWLFAALVLTIVLVFVPLAIYTFSLRTRRKKTVIIAVSGVTIFTFWRAGLLVDGLLDGMMEDDISFGWPMALRLLALSAVPVFECFVLMLLHRKVLPIVLRSGRPDDAQLIEPHRCDLRPTSVSTAAERSRTIKLAALYTSLLAITLYMGCHFSTVRKMRNDPFFTLDVIWAELERLGVSSEGLHMENMSDVLEAGLSASCRMEVVVDNRTRYSVSTRKHMLVPWVRVDMSKMEGAGPTGE